MGQQKGKSFIKSNDMVLTGISLGLVFWFLEASIHAYIFHRGSFSEETLPKEPHELWMRSLVVFLIILFGIFAQYMVNRHRRAEQALRDSEKELRILSKQLFTVQEDERARVSRDLHENISQYLCSIKFKMESDLNADEKNASGLEEGAYKKVIAMIQDVVENLRKISMNLWPGTLDVLGIVGAIQSLLEEFRELNPRIRVIERFNVSEDDVPQALKITIYRVLQDALKNLALHSKADQVSINLVRVDHRLLLDVNDNGTGLNWTKIRSAKSSERGTGLASMKERTELSGGLFLIETEEGRGTRLRVSWPMNPGKN